MNKRERPLSKEAAAAHAAQPTVPQRRKTPSFSSSLLESIYRSIDESGGQDQASPLFPDPGLIKKQGTHKTRHGDSPSSSSYSHRELSNLRRAMMIEEWMEKQSSRNSSDSSSAATFSTLSSSETESTHRAKPRALLEDRKGGGGDNAGGFSKTKLRALKIYGELKKVKQPISPGGRITSFLNSIFNSGNVKKAKMCYVGAVDDVSFERKSKSACSSASSFSRSCMSKTPSTRSKLKRSVRFYPMSVIVGEDSQPCGHKCIYEDDRKAKNGGGGCASLVVSQREREARVEAGRERYFQKKMDARGMCKNRVVVSGYSDEDEDDDDDEDMESDASSDLFELDHLIGVGRYREELPVYETTCLKKNQAIAHGLIL
ncbi:hypothetical protein NL676_035898 [Syzygium grande]|nr:hypothetical protein NL676_035898 [Syzygium grande]